MGKQLSVGFSWEGLPWERCFQSVYPWKEAFSRFTMGKRLSVGLPWERGFLVGLCLELSIGLPWERRFSRFTLGKRLSVCLPWERGFQWVYPGKEAFSLFTLGKRLSVGLPWERGFQSALSSRSVYRSMYSISCLFSVICFKAFGIRIRLSC